MGYVRNMAMIAFAAVLATGGRDADAAPAEPLVVAELREPVLQVVVLRDPAADAVSEEALRFARALDHASFAQRQAAAARCRSIREIPAKGSGREAWEANCRYTRR